MGELLVPWYQSEMEKLTASEESHSGVTADPELSALARRTAFRGTSWGIAAIAVLLGIVISAGPSMGFVYGTGKPDLNLQIILIGFLATLVLVTLGSLARSSQWAPVSVIASSLLIFGLTIVSFANSLCNPWWVAWAGIAATLVGLWQIESIIANVAMRPRWLVRREWRIAVSISVALAIGSLTLL